jgi:GNAT superfamily N-acetyltransferase
LSEYAGPQLLADHHSIDDFTCGEPALDQWLRTRARANQRHGASRVWVATLDDCVVAFYASSTSVVLRARATKRAARNQPDPIPAILLGRLAVDQRHQSRGLAAALLKHFIEKSLEVAELTGVRLLLVHAKDRQAREFYERYGFEPSPIDELTLMLILGDIRKA